MCVNLRKGLGLIGSLASWGFVEFHKPTKFFDYISHQSAHIQYYIFSIRGFISESQIPFVLTCWKISFKKPFLYGKRFTNCTRALKIFTNQNQISFFIIQRIYWFFDETFQSFLSCVQSFSITYPIFYYYFKSRALLLCKRFLWIQRTLTILAIRMRWSVLPIQKNQR